MAAVLTGLAYAETATLTWTHSGLDVKGQAETLATFRVYQSDSQTGAFVLTDTVPASSRTATITMRWVPTSCMRLTAMDAADNESLPSAVVCKTVVVEPPPPPPFPQPTVVVDATGATLTFPPDATQPTVIRMHHDTQVEADLATVGAGVGTYRHTIAWPPSTTFVCYVLVRGTQRSEQGCNAVVPPPPDTTPPTSPMELRVAALEQRLDAVLLAACTLVAAARTFQARVATALGGCR